MFTNNAARFVFALVVLLALVQTGTSLKCYTCTECADFDSTKAKEFPCPDTAKKCFKLNVAGESQRGCEMGNTCSVAPNDCHTCDTDLCNSSSNILPSFVVISIVALVSARQFF